jgi:POT family proton-dependent oligopeptide transporter
MAIGTLIAAGGPGLMMIAGGIVDATHQRVGFGWTLAYTIANDLGFANILPVGLALYSRVAPKQIVGLVIGIYYLHLSIGNTYVGWLAGLMDKMPSSQFWGLHAMLVAIGGGLLLVVHMLFWRYLSPAAVAPKGEPSAELAPAH